MNTRAVDTAEAAQSGAYYCEVPSEPCAIVMFGASGDLAKRKLLPALYDLGGPCLPGAAFPAARICAHAK